MSYPDMPLETLENRIRSATRALAGSWPASEVTPLRLPESAWFLASRIRWSARWLAPVAAAVAVVAVILAGLTVGGAMHHAGNPAAAGRPGGAPSGPLAAGPPAAHFVSAGLVPPYFVQVTYDGNQNVVAQVPSYAVIRATATGAKLGTVRPSVPGYTILAVTAAGDDRTFVLDEEKWISPSDTKQNSSWQVRSFYLLRLRTDGAPRSVTRLPMTAFRLVTGVALSPDGSKLAIAVQPQTTSDPNLTEVRVYTLATGAVRTWSGDGGIGGGADDATSISWTADGRLLFNWDVSGPEQTVSGTRLLDLSLPGTSLVGSSRWVTELTLTAIPSGLSTLRCGSGTVTPDGTGVICGAVALFNQSVTQRGLHRDARIAFLKYSTATGKPVATLGSWLIKNAGGLYSNVMWTNPSGTVIIGAIPNQGDTGRIGIISNNKFTDLHIPGHSGFFYGVW